MNKVILSGYVAQDIELKSTQSGTYVCTFSVGVKRPHQKETITDFITCVAWRQSAEFMHKYFQKGSGIELSGTLQTRKWQDQNGNSRTAVEVLVDEVEFPKKSGKNESQSQSQLQSANEEPPFEDVGGDDELPF